MSVPREPSTTKLWLLKELEDDSRATDLAPGELAGLRAVAHWIKTFIVNPHDDLGRSGPVCPFVPRSLDRDLLSLAPEQVGERNLAEVVEVLQGYQRLFTSAQPTDGDDATYKSIVVVFTDLAEERAAGFFGDVLEQLAMPSYAADGFVMGGFHESSPGTAIYNPGFRPFTSPVPFLLMRHAVVDDWKFFLDDEEWLAQWARRHQDSGAHALAEELRRLPWRTRPDRATPPEEV
ncbi:DUF6875 domain-containing protein [Kribbella sp. CA-247076]|uniref:DUF6875 domain-containing protein n=1 Tax=Kribbella sp. CA-247076 TaxID=3239941 RepID=UPI003D8DC3FC